jgi:hypothetical protein
MNDKPERIPIPWKLPTKIPGDSMIYPQTPRDHIAHRVLQEVSVVETKEWGRTIAPETILFNCAFYPSTYTRVISARMQERYKQLEKENRNGKKKYINQFKSEG